MERIQKLFESPRLFWTLSTVVLILSYLRIFFGADTTDEAYYVAISLLSAHGAVPYISDMYFQQNASLVYEPISFAYHFLFGNDGIMLFVRHLYFFLSLGVSSIYFFVFRRFLKPEIAAAIVLLPICFIPFGIPSLGYNTIAGFFFSLGVGFLLNAILGERKTLLLALTAVSFGLSVFAYPMFLTGVVTAVLLAAIWLWNKNRNLIKPIFIMSGASALMVILLWLTILHRVGLEDLKTSLEVTLNYGALGDITAKIDYGMSIFRFYSPTFWEITGVLVVGVALRKFFSISWLWVVAALSVLALLHAPDVIGFAAHFLISYICFLATPIFLFIFRDMFRDMKDEKWVASILFLSSLLTSFVLGWTSANSFLVMALTNQYCIMALLFIESIRRSTRLTIFVSALTLYGIIIFCSYGSIYRDDPIRGLDHMMKSGPYAGIMTSKVRFDLLNEFEEDVNAAAKVGKSIVFYDYFPAGFLFSDLYPATRSIFIHPLPYGWPTRKMYVEFYKKPLNRPDIVFQIETFPIYSYSTAHFRPEWTKSPDDDFFDFLPNTGDYTLFRARTHYKVWVKKNL